MSKYSARRLGPMLLWAFGAACLQSSPGKADAVTSLSQATVAEQTTSGQPLDPNGEPLVVPTLSLVPSVVSVQNVHLNEVVGPAAFPDLASRRGGGFAAALLTQGQGPIFRAYTGDAAGQTWLPMGQIAVSSAVTVTGYALTELPFRVADSAPDRLLLALTTINTTTNVGQLQNYASDDAGSTWSEVGSVAIGGAIFNLGDPALFVDDEQNVQLYWTQRDPPTNAGRKLQYVYRSISYDHGASWSQRAVSVSSSAAVRFPSIAQLPAAGARQIVMAMEDYEGTDASPQYCTYVKTSTDNGASWSARALILQSRDPNTFFAAPKIMNRGDGTLLIATSTNENAQTVNTQATGGRNLKVFVFTKVPTSGNDVAATLETFAAQDFHYSMLTTPAGNLLTGFVGNTGEGAIGQVLLQ